MSDESQQSTEQETVTGDSARAASEAASSKPQFTWEKRDKFRIHESMQQMLLLTKKLSEMEIARLRRKIDKLTYGS